MSTRHAAARARKRLFSRNSPRLAEAGLSVAAPRPDAFGHNARHTPSRLANAMPWFLYLIECADGSLYTGIATDVEARFAAHLSGKGARYTRARKPLRVMASFELTGRSEASRAEYFVKRLTPRQKRELIEGGRTLASVVPCVEAAVDLEDGA